MSASAGSRAGCKCCTVAYATRERQYSWHLELPEGASIAQALAAARAQAASQADTHIPWDECEVGIFGEPCARSATFADGDRIELYRPLRCDPRQRRRERVRHERRGARTRAG